MSAIGTKIDELRELALWLDDEFYDVEAAKVRDAADTIQELRELVGIMRFCQQVATDCDDCKFNGGDSRIPQGTPCGCYWLTDRMRELGVGEE